MKSHLDARYCNIFPLIGKKEINHTILHNHVTCSKDAVEEKDEQAEFETGPLSVLMQSVKQNSQVCSQTPCCFSMVQASTFNHTD